MADDALSLIERSSEARRNRDHDAAVSPAQQAAESARDCGDLDALGSALAALGRLRRDEHQARSAVELYEQSAAIARQQGDELALAHRPRHIGDVVADEGDLERAERCYEEAGQLFDRHDVGKLHTANFLRSKALLREKQGANASAAALWSDARSLYAETGITAGVEESDRRLQRLSPR